MNPTLRYIITRPCLSEGTLTVAKYLEPLFPAELAGQTLHLMDEQGRDYPVQLSKNAKRLSGVGALYHHHNLDVNDVLLLSNLSDGRYQVSCVVKPHTERLNGPPRSEPLAAPTRQVFINATPHVREVRLERARPPAPRRHRSVKAVPAPPRRPTAAPISTAAPNRAPSRRPASWKPAPLQTRPALSAPDVKTRRGSRRAATPAATPKKNFTRPQRWPRPSI